MKVYFILLLSIILISTIPLSFAPSHLQVGGQQPIDDMESTSASSVSCERDSQGNLIFSNIDPELCDFIDGLIDCDNPIDYFHHSGICDNLEEGNSGLMNLMLLVFVIIGILIVVLVIAKRRK